MNQIIPQIEQITLNPFRSVAQKMDEILALGSLLMDADMGAVVEVRGNQCRISRVVSIDSIHMMNGQVTNVGDCYTALVVQAAGLVNVGHMNQSPYRTERCYRNYRFESFIGVPMLVDGQIFGTLEFASLRGREGGFDSYQTDAMYVMGASLADLIEWDMRSQQASRATRVVKAIHLEGESSPDTAQSGH